MTDLRRDSPRDGGSILILTLGFVVTALLLVLAVTDASAVFLARRDLAAAADAAALDAAQQIDRAAVYQGQDGSVLPLSPQLVTATVTTFVAEEYPPNRYPGWHFTATTPDGIHAVVTATRVLRLPVYGSVTVVAQSVAVSATG
ncbi:MAG: pilus assembly protein TadG-related protein [Mycobacteriales bacterium]